MPESTQDAGGVMDSVRRLISSLLGLVQTRAELFTVELQEEKLRAIRLLLWLSAAVVFGVAGVFVAIVVLAMYLWQTLGYIGLASLALGALVVAMAILWIIRRQILRGPQPFAETVAEFRKDFECLRHPD